MNPRKMTSSTKGATKTPRAANIKAVVRYLSNSSMGGLDELGQRAEALRTVRANNTPRGG
jgi:hypothetical protein